MDSILDNLLRRLAHPTQGTSPCRICSSQSDTGDLCNKCIQDEVKLRMDDGTADKVCEMLIDVGKLNKALDRIEGEMKVIKGRNGCE